MIFIFNCEMMKYHRFVAKFLFFFIVTNTNPKQAKKLSSIFTLLKLGSVMKGNRTHVSHKLVQIIGFENKFRYSSSISLLVGKNPHII